MATTRTFQAMLNEYLPNQLLKEELLKRDYLLQKVEKDDNWKGGNLVVPFKAAGASSVAFGGLTADTDVAEDKYVRGGVSDYKEAWGTMLINQRDIMEHGAISEQNLLNIIPDAIDDFISYMKSVVSTNLLNGSHMSTLTGDGQVGGTMVVANPDRFVIGQKVFLIDGNTAISAAGFVSAIDNNTGTITLVTARGGATPLDISAYTVAQAAKVYGDGASTNSFSSLRGALLSLANGGDTNLYGVAKTAYPYLQAINISGAAVVASNIMEQIFDALTTIRRLGKGNPTDIIMSYKNLGSCMKIVEQSKGSYNVAPGSSKASQYGFWELEIGSVAQGAIKLVGVQECDDDVIMFIDWRALCFHSNGFFMKNKSPDGNEYFVKRATSGFQYILDICLYGELVVKRPSYCGIMHSISYT